MVVNEMGHNEPQMRTCADEIEAATRDAGSILIRELVMKARAARRKQLHGRCVRFDLRINTAFRLQNPEIKIALSMRLRCFAR